jgi:hypothetical protein
MADHEQPHVGFDQPASREVESREETVDRAVQDASVQRVEPTLETVDPSQRRGFNRDLRRRLGLVAIAGFLAGAALGVILGVLPGPFELRGQGDSRGDTALEWSLYCVVLGIAIALVATVIVGLVLTQRENGRVQREVEAKLPADPGAPEVSAPPRDPSAAGPR